MGTVTTLRDIVTLHLGLLPLEENVTVKVMVPVMRHPNCHGARKGFY